MIKVFSLKKRRKKKTKLISFLVIRSIEVPWEKLNSGIVKSNVNRRIRKENYMRPARASIARYP